MVLPSLPAGTVVQPPAKFDATVFYPISSTFRTLITRTISHGKIIMTAVAFFVLNFHTNVENKWRPDVEMLSYKLLRHADHKRCRISVRRNGRTVGVGMGNKKIKNE
jgi:hypothetical protein